MSKDRSCETSGENLDLKKHMERIYEKVTDVVNDTAHGSIKIVIQGGRIVQLVTEKSELVK